MSTYYKHGDWNAICDRCGEKLKASKLKLEWTGLRVCKKCWEPRHEQDFVRGKKEDNSVPWSRPEGANAGGTDIAGNSTRYSGTCGPSNIAGMAIAGCAIAGNIKGGIPSL